MRYCQRITGYTDSQPGYDGKKTRRNFECFVTYDEVDDNEAVITSFLKYYCSHDPAEDPGFSRQFFNDYNCAKALVTYYFRDSFQLFEMQHHEFVSEAALPSREPDKCDKNHKIWVTETVSKEMETPKSAARHLFDLCSDQKLPVDMAQRIVRDTFPSCHFAWQSVLFEFSKLGGAYTKKYIRRR